MRGLIIDPKAKTISPVDTDGSLDDMYRLMNCDDINSVRVTRDDMLWVDGEGFLKPDLPVFRLAGYGHPLAGKGLVLGIDAAGESCSVSPVAEGLLRAKVQWSVQVSAGKLGPSSEGPGYFKIGDPILKDAQS